MKQLESQSQTPRSSIHFYLREGVLPPPEKTASNASLYSQAHLSRLQAIRRQKEGGRVLPLGLLKRAAELMDRGVEPDVALDLEQSVLGAVDTSQEATFVGSEELATAAGVDVTFVQTLLDHALLVPPAEGAGFDGADLTIVRTLSALVNASGLDVALAAPISRGIREISEYEMSLRNRAAEAMDDQSAAELTLAFQQGVQTMHAYLFYRWRLRDIERLRIADGEVRDA